MRRISFFLFLFLSYRISEAQVLLSDTNFENYVSCPTGPGQLQSQNDWFNPATNVFSVSGTPDYYNGCSTSSSADVPDNDYGHQAAHSGVGYCGIVLWYGSLANSREYIEQELIQPLVAGQCYHFSMYVALSELSRYTTDAIGVYFSNQAIRDINNASRLPYTAQINNTAGNVLDTTNWTLVSADYTAVGGEKYMIVGNFSDDAATTLTTSNSNGYSFVYVYLDDVNLNSCSTGINEKDQVSGITFSPNPFSDRIDLASSLSSGLEIIVYDLTSKKLLQEHFTHSVSLTAVQWEKGIYLYEVKDKGVVVQKGKWIKD